jgi:hypothetical protein
VNESNREAFSVRAENISVREDVRSRTTNRSLERFHQLRVEPVVLPKERDEKGRRGERLTESLGERRAFLEGRPSLSVCVMKSLMSNSS